ncbi:MAG: hypothetical protein H0W61_15345 [Bacteroidetes bacterium]|nr:hypothetical protein [Bacteroidota bacterium]
MQNDYNDQFTNDLAPAPKRPQFLKILCILSFVMCGIWILIYTIGSCLLGMSEESAAAAMEKIQESSASIKIENPEGFVHEIGMVCLMGLLANIVSLLGVVMMWRLNRIGFFIYVIAELAANFIGMNMNAGSEGDKSYGSLIFIIVLDLIFIVMYALNLKHMNKRVAVQ